jgi:hypothetical protein
MLAAWVTTSSLVRADYLLMNPPPDADKPGIPGDNTCYAATASNMLAGAGYGNGATVQARAMDIYSQMVANYGTANGGWVDSALTWWLNSANNTWKLTNPYNVVTMFGNKSPKNPWANVNGATTIGNNLRSNNFVGLSISWPVAGATVGTGGHAITAWGDNATAGSTAGLTQVKVTDSDTDAGGNVQTYTYDAYNNPNPGGPNEGNGWYFNYGSGDNPYIKHIAVLSPSMAGNFNTQRVTGSLAVHQNSFFAATDLHYTAKTDVQVLSYNTRISVPGTLTSLTEIGAGAARRGINADWDLIPAVAQGQSVTITTDFIVPTWNSISYSNVHFTYPDFAGTILPNFNWQIDTLVLSRTEPLPNNATGGFVVGAFDIFADPNGQNPLGTYRFSHEYDFFQDPEHHQFMLNGFENQTDFYIGNLKFGHAYGQPDDDELWSFQDWMTNVPALQPVNERGFTLPLDWLGLLPYPSAEDFPAVPEPSTFVLGSFGLMALVQIVERRRKR